MKDLLTRIFLISTAIGILTLVFLYKNPAHAEEHCYQALAPHYIEVPCHD